PRQRSADLPVEAAHARRVHLRQARDPDDLSHPRHLAAGDRPADRADQLRRQFHVPHEEPVPVPGDYRVFVHHGDDGVVCDAGAVVAVEQQPLRRHPVCSGDLLHPGGLRCGLCRDAQHRDVVDLVLRQSLAGRRRDFPRDAEVRDAVAGLAADDRRPDCAVGVRARASGARRRGRRVTGIIAADHLSKWYGQVIGLNDVSVAVPSGITGLLGPNGAGKSTFMKLITGQLKPSKGSIAVLGAPIWGNPALYHRIGFCPEQDSFYERMTGLEWVTALVRLNGAGDQEAASMASRAIEMVELTDASNKKIGAYSK